MFVAFKADGTEIVDKLLCVKTIRSSMVKNGTKRGHQRGDRVEINRFGEDILAKKFCSELRVAIVSVKYPSWIERE